MKVLVVHYSMYGHVLQLAESVVEGVKSVAGVEAVWRRVKEFRTLNWILPSTSTPWRCGNGSRISPSAPWTT